MSHHPTRSSEIYRRIDELSSLASKDPAQVQKVLPAALEELKICLEEPPLTDEEQMRSASGLRKLYARLTQGSAMPRRTASMDFVILQSIRDDAGRIADFAWT